jgi:hypothetical protein
MTVTARAHDDEQAKAEATQKEYLNKVEAHTAVDISYAAPQAYRIINVVLHREYSPSIVFIFF